MKHPIHSTEVAKNAPIYLEMYKELKTKGLSDTEIAGMLGLSEGVLRKYAGKTAKKRILSPKKAEKLSEIRAAFEKVLKDARSATV